MAYTKKTAPKSEDSSAIVESVVEDTSCDREQSEESKIWTTLESGKNKTYVMNVSTGCIIRTESSNGSTMCYLPNTRYEQGYGFKRIN